MSDLQKTNKTDERKKVPFTSLSSPLDVAVQAHRKLQHSQTDLHQKIAKSKSAKKSSDNKAKKTSKKTRSVEQISFSNKLKKLQRDIKSKRLSKTKSKAKSSANKSQPKKKHKKSAPVNYGLLASVIVFILMLGAVYILWPYSQKSTTGDQTFFADIDLSNLSRSAFDKKLNAKIPELLGAQYIEIEIEGQKHPKSIYDLGVTLNLDNIFQQALEKDEERAKEHRTFFWQSKPSEPLPAINLSYSYQMDNDRLDDVVQALAKEYNSKYADAKVTGFDTTNRKFIISPDKSEVLIDNDQLKNDLPTLVANNTVVSGLFKIPVKEHREPKVKAADLEEKLGFVSEAITYLPYRSEGRDKNIRRACEVFQGYIIEPGATLSYNDVIGPQTIENGYAEAYAVEDGIPYLELGGGLCQTSTVLYQAALKADLDIVERHNHGEMISYANYGQDAMVADWADLRIANNTEYPYAIYTHYDDEEGSALFAIYGLAVKDGATIELVSEKVRDVYADDKVEYRINKDLNPGEIKQIRKRKDGSVWSTYKAYYKDGEEVGREYLADSYYDPYTAVFECHTKPTATTTTTDPNSTTTTTTTTTTVVEPEPDVVQPDSDDVQSEP